MMNLTFVLAAGSLFVIVLAITGAKERAERERKTYDAQYVTSGCKTSALSFVALVVLLAALWFGGFLTV